MEGGGRSLQHLRNKLQQEQKQEPWLGLSLATFSISVGFSSICSTWQQDEAVFEAKQPIPEHLLKEDSLHLLAITMVC